MQIARSTARAAASSPTRRKLDGPPRPSPRTRNSPSVTCASVFVPALVARAEPILNPEIADRFQVTTFATGLNFPSSMQRLDDGSILVGTSDPVSGSIYNSTGTLLRFTDEDDDGVADGAGQVVFTGLTGTVTSVLVPWNSCGAYMTGVLGVSTLQYAPWALFNYFNPLIAVGYALTGFRIERLDDDAAGGHPDPGAVVDAPVHDADADAALTGDQPSAS